ncbi:pilus assembly protein PilE [Bacillus sp. M6-12]|uniref:type II secretion system protein n=1 Tax=Bacillus sp. M6-12 TaxID=2054166 RepID=UPI000C783264|nr:type II secretion system protein [Bacillus sp. M6-12]PLS16858.1 pilus assembly protein PilE [Bacillus sp. M6-12]
MTEIINFLRELALIKKLLLNQKGLTMIELLAVIVILGIIAAIAVLSIGGLIQKNRTEAFIANALAIREAAVWYLQDHILQEEVFQNEISYAELVTEGYLEVIQDPDTGERWGTENNGSFVTVRDQEIEAVCLFGLERQLCGESDEPILFNDLSNEHVMELN